MTYPVRMKASDKPLPKTRPRAGRTARAEQLRLAKRAQRDRDRKAGLVEARLKLPGALAERLAAAAMQDGFKSALEAFLETETIEIANYPQLKLLCWNRRARFVSAREAWELYERNWRFIEPDRLETAERELISALVDRFGGGVMNV
jgi:hypothetical protein